uniref:Uncharacterized protein n=1 Tax=Anguilla anguilla TaxID=7936 RepID=A0A0E9V501_ANGAN
MNWSGGVTGYIDKAMLIRLKV